MKSVPFNISFITTLVPFAGTLNTMIWPSWVPDENNTLYYGMYVLKVLTLKLPTPKIIDRNHL